MRVLWFTVTPSLAASHLNVSVTGRGWIESLHEKINDIQGIDLAVAFVHGEKELVRFNLDKTTYFAIPSRTPGKIKKLMDRHLNRVDDSELIEYCIKVVNDYKPDIINIFGTEEAFGLISDKVNVPVVIHLQGLLTVYEKKWYPPGISKIDLLKRAGIKNILKANTLVQNYYYYKRSAIRERQIFKVGRYFIGRTDWDKRVSAVLSPKSKYFYGSEILRKDFYSNTWFQKPNETKIFLSTIQANIFKGLETILACAIILKELDQFKFKWVIAGISDDDEMVRIFEKKAGRKFRDCNVALSGRVKAAELINIQLGADIFIHPSHIDNSPNSVCEAMLLGMPVIATYTGGTGSLLVEKKEGILIQDGDPYSMAGAITELIDNPGYAVQLGQNARAAAIKRHNPDIIVNNLLSIYSRIISTPAN
jgi:glycosyltransferase involved in cell wall biosynthesis